MLCVGSINCHYLVTKIPATNMASKTLKTKTLSSKFGELAVKSKKDPSPSRRPSPPRRSLSPRTRTAMPRGRSASPKRRSASRSRSFSRTRSGSRSSSSSRSRSQRRSRSPPQSHRRSLSPFKGALSRKGTYLVDNRTFKDSFDAVLGRYHNKVAAKRYWKHKARSFKQALEVLTPAEKARVMKRYGEYKHGARHLAPQKKKTRR